MTEQIIIAAGTTREMLIVNAVDIRLHIQQQAGSTLRLYLFCLDDDNNNATITVEQRNSGCNTEIYGLAVTRGAQHANWLTQVKHISGGGKSRQLFKYILADQSQCSFKGELYIAPDAQHTDAQQTNRNLLLSADARMQTQPQLEIYADDVKASHGASTGQIDPTALFYMQQRCLDNKQARLLLIQAFAADIAENITDEKQRETVLQALAERLQQIADSI